MKKYLEFIKKISFALSAFIIIPLVLYVLAKIFSFIGFLLQIYRDLLSQYLGMSEIGAGIVCMGSLFVIGVTLIFAVLDFIYYVPETIESKDKT